MESKRCDASCESLRSVLIGFDGSRYTAPYNGKDRKATCAHDKRLNIYPGAKHSCPFHEED